MSVRGQVFSPFLPAFGDEAGRADGYPLPLQVGTEGGSTGGDGIAPDGPSDSTARKEQATTATAMSPAMEAEEAVAASASTTAASRRSLRVTGTTGNTAHPVGGGLMRRALPANIGLMTLMRVSGEEEEEEEGGRRHRGGGGAGGGDNQAPGLGDLTLLVRKARQQESPKSRNRRAKTAEELDYGGCLVPVLFY